ncbi:armadillo-type protein [Mycena epipterygia]|nr:armadillo-type protein [Mycena epipterygia]
MHPLTRQRTLESVLSWWSDRNPPGPTINLHAASKPLMRLLYHRAVLDVIKKNRDTPLSSEILEIYYSYVAFKYVSRSAKAAILRELQIRAVSEEEARAVAHSPVFDRVMDLLESPDSEIRRWTCKIVGNLVFHESLAGAIMTRTLCVKLVSLLDDKDIQVVEGAVYALAQITRWPDGAQRSVAANILDHLVELLESPNAGVQR